MYRKYIYGIILALLLLVITNSCTTITFNTSVNNGRILDVTIETPGSSETSLTKISSSEATPTKVSIYPQSPSIGLTKVSLKDDMLMVYVPAGNFMMGSTDGWPEEKPIHTVYLDSFWIDQTEVTNASYALCVKAGSCQPPTNKSSNLRAEYYDNPEYDQYPVIYVDYSDANDYCQWAGQHLPTEAEWEKTARGTDERTYPWGNSLPKDQMANFNNDIMDTTKVGSYPDVKSPYGVLDMAGNVEEWVEDWFGPTYYVHSILDNPLGPSDGSFRVLRGGNWLQSWFYLRTAYRNSFIPDGSSYDVGFRCAQSIP